MSIEEQCTGCVGAGSYKDYASKLGYKHVEAFDWTSSAGDWQFLISKDEFCWRMLFQENNYPNLGFSHSLGDEEYYGTIEEVADMLSKLLS